MKIYVPTRNDGEMKVSHLATKCGQCDTGSPYIGGKWRVKKFTIVAEESK